MPLITQSSSVTEPTHTPVARQAQPAPDGGPAQLAANETPCEISKSSATLQCSWGLPSRLGRPDVQDEKTSGDTVSQCTASPPGQGKILGPTCTGHSIKGQEHRIQLGPGAAVPGRRPFQADQCSQPSTAARLPMGAKCGKVTCCGLWVQRSNPGYYSLLEQSSGISK